MNERLTEENCVVFLLLTEKQRTLCFRFKDTRSSILQEDPYILHDNGTLEIRIAQAQHNGKYTCVATNGLGIYENHVYLEVKGKNAPL